MTRECGTCHECCVHLPVEPLNKPKGIACEHLNVLSDCGSCAIYDQRPNACQLYKCSWLEGLFVESLKPDKCGILAEVAYIGKPLILTLVMGFEHVAGSVEKHMDDLRASVKPGLVIAIVTKSFQPVIIGEEKDVNTFIEWRDFVEKQGTLTSEYADGTVEHKIEDGPW